VRSREGNPVAAHPVNAPASFPAPAGYLARQRGWLPDWRRVPVLAIVIALHVLLLLMLLLLAPPLPKGKPGVNAMMAVNVAAPSPQRAQPKPLRQQQPKPVSNPVPKPEVTIADAPPAKWTFGDPELQNFDLRNLPKADAAPAQMAEAGPPDSAVVGLAPDGSKLYAAEWFREPTDAELAFYIRGRGQPGNWGAIACRTAPRFRVVDCRPIGESPGSRLGYAVNEAAWQFRVKPPRINGEYQVGTWVSIRIDLRGAE
jgi:periplasmic protein TonB